MEISLWIMLFVYMECISIVIGYSCRRCDQFQLSQCPPANCTPPAMPISDVCECCTVCSKIEGEECGGLYALKGKCTEGLICYVKEDKDKVNSERFDFGNYGYVQHLSVI